VPEVIRELRAAWAEEHHVLDQEETVGKVDATAYAVQRARESGVPDEVCAQLATEAFQCIIQDIPARRKERQWPKRDRASQSFADGPDDLPRGDTQRQLPPGD
jgi:hypothetical protein